MLTCSHWHSMCAMVVLILLLPLFVTGLMRRATVPQGQVVPQCFSTDNCCQKLFSVSSEPNNHLPVKGTTAVRSSMAIRIKSSTGQQVQFACEITDARKTNQGHLTHMGWWIMECPSTRRLIVPSEEAQVTIPQDRVVTSTLEYSTAMCVPKSQESSQIIRPGSTQCIQIDVSARAFQVSITGNEDYNAATLDSPRLTLYDADSSSPRPWVDEIITSIIIHSVVLHANYRVCAATRPGSLVARLRVISFSS